MIKINEYWTKEMDQKISRINYLYHTVFNQKSYDYVKKNGITADSNGFIYLSEKPIIKHNNNSWSINNTVAVFKVRIPNKSKLHDWREIWMDDDGNETDSDHQYDKSNPYYIYMDRNIPLSYIEEVKI